MTHRPLLLVPGLIALVGVSLPAAEGTGPTINGPSPTPANNQPTPRIIGAGDGAVELSPGQLRSVGREVYIQGLLDLDALQQVNYFDGNDDNPNLSDRRSEGWYRAEVGTRIAVDNRIEVLVTVAGQGVMGDSRATENGLVYNNPSSTTNAPSNGDSGNAVIDDAVIKLKDFLNYRELALDVGRQPVSWNLRRDHGAFLYDSRANYPTITSWDGLRAAYNLDTVNISPYVFRLPDNSQLYGATIDWEPARAGNDRIFITASANLERNVRLNNGSIGDELQTYYVGIDADFKELELYGEFAMQDGDETNGVSFGGIGFNLGLDWHLNQFMVGLQYDFMSGDDNPTDNENKAFINTWEAVSDTYIVENEKYGELSRLLQGNLEAYKAKLEIALDDKKRVRVKTIYAWYKTNKATASGAHDFGQELDLHLAWDFTPNATITLITAAFQPDGAYVDSSTAGADANDDLIYLLGANLQVKF